MCVYVPVQAGGGIDPKIYVWDVEMDTLQYFNFESGRGEQDEYVPVGGETQTDYSDAERSAHSAGALSPSLLFPQSPSLLKDRL